MIFPAINLYLIGIFHGYVSHNQSLNQHNYGKIHHFIAGKSTISMAMFNSYLKLPEGINHGFMEKKG